MISDEEARAVERERLLALARAASSLEPVEQRNAVKGLIGESLWSRTCTPMEILEAAYGDPEGRRYWELWLFEPLRLYLFAELLAVHYAATEGPPVASVLGKSAPVLDGYLRQIFERLRAAAKAGETWLIGDKSSLLTETWSFSALRNSAVTVRPREAIAWLYRNPNARHLVPATPAQMAGSFRDDLAAAGQPSMEGAQAVPKSNRDLDALQSPAPTTPTRAPPATGIARRNRKGPAPGTIDRFGDTDRALFPEIEHIMSEGHKSVHAAALELASDGKIQGGGTPESRAKRLAALFRKEKPRTATR
jgi:hypothetical protein